jgi:sensor histidine kinase regulating citrate/malate metabolism
VKWWRRLTLRARLMVLGAGGLAAGFAIGGVALVAALGLALQRTVDQQASATAHEVATMVDSGALPQPMPVAGT